MKRLQIRAPGDSPFSAVKERLEETLQTLQDRRIRITVVHGTGDGVIPIRQSQVLAERYSNIQLRPVKDFVHHFPSSHSHFTAHLLHQEVLRYREASCVRTSMRSHSVATAVGCAADPSLSFSSRNSLYTGSACTESL
ncbi:hydrolase, alpha/beta fold family protein [Toxoplasma gondii MAS]|uniref:Hydrolase, alpha/beta fold family protein n=1 Tax=Toxoplasma gondii MAS TaxID=943118 RepID=A0A086QY00_TOXGO|nr:hydrolase, alpha/beta fold family protein [Toxoplasma gondii MAS]